MDDFGRVLAVVPARGGSKGIPQKNLRQLGGRTLLARTLELAVKVPYFTAVAVSTDSHEIAEASGDQQSVVVVERPFELSGDRVADAPVLEHTVTSLESRLGLVFDIVVMLQVTSPFRTPEDIYACLSVLSSEKCDAVWTVSPTELHYHPLKQLTVDSNSQLAFFDDRGFDIVARQQLRPVFHRNGCCYAVRRDFLMETHSLFSPGATRAVVSEGLRVNIDTLQDLELAERLLDGEGL